MIVCDKVCLSVMSISRVLFCGKIQSSRKFLLGNLWQLSSFWRICLYVTRQVQKKHFPEYVVFIPRLVFKSWTENLEVFKLFFLFFLSSFLLIKDVSDLHFLIYKGENLAINGFLACLHLAFLTWNLCILKKNVRSDSELFLWLEFSVIILLF